MAQPDANPNIPAEAAANADVPAEANVTAEADVAEKADVATESDAITDLENRLRRALADADNLRKRTAREVADARAAERTRVASSWLPIVDNLERALDHANPEHDPVIEGVRAVRDQAVALLSTLGFARHDETGVGFDPQLHEAVSVLADGEAPAGTVLQVLRPGYGEGAHQLRPAAVVVSAGPPSDRTPPDRPDSIETELGDVDGP